MTYKFGQVLTPEEISLVPVPSDPWIEPTEIQIVPTPEEMATWMPDPDPAKRRFRWEINVQTNERKAIELTLEEYRQRHVNKIKSKNEWLLRKREEDRKAIRQVILDRLIDAELAKEI